MKQLIVLAFVCLAGTHFAHAQVKKGNILVGGTLGIDWSKTKTETSDAESKNNSYIISPKAGYALSDNWVVGVFANTVFYKTEAKSGAPGGVNLEIKNYEFMPGVFVRHYKMIGGKIALYGEASAAYGHGSGEQNDVKYMDYDKLLVQVKPGISYFINQRLLIDGEFGGIEYAHVKSDNIPGNTKSTSSSFGLNFTQQFELGVSFLF